MVTSLLESTCETTSSSSEGYVSCLRFFTFTDATIDVRSSLSWIHRSLVDALCFGLVVGLVVGYHYRPSYWI